MFRRMLPRKFLVKLIVSFSTLLSFFTIALSTLLYSNFEKMTLDSVAATNLNYLQQISYSADYMNESAVNLLTNIYLDAKTVSLMYQANNDFEELRKESVRLKQLAEVNPFVHSIYIYNKKLDRYLGTWAEILTLEKPFFDQEAVEMLAHQSPKLTPIARNIVSPFGNGQEIPVFTYVLYEFLSPEAGVEGAVILNVKSEYLQNMTEVLKQKSQQSGSEVFVLSNQGTLISNAKGGEHLTFDEHARKTIIAAINEDERGHFTSTLDNGKYLITYNRSQPMGWYFIMLQPYSSVLSNFAQIRDITIQCAVIVLLAGVIASIIMSRKINSPLERLFKKIAKVQGYKDLQHNRHDEIKVLEQIVSDSYGNQRVMKTKQALRHFARNGVMPERNEDMELKVNVNIRSPIVVISIRIDHYQKFVKQYSFKERELLCFAFTNVIKEHFSADYPCDSVDLGEDLLFAMIEVCPDRWETVEQDLIQRLSEAQTWCLTHLGFSFTCVYSDIVTDAGEVPSLLHHLQQLAQYRFIYGHGSILTEQVADKHQAEMKLSTIEETELLDFLTNGQLEEAKITFNIILEKQKSLKYESLVSNMLQLAYVIYNRLFDLEEYGRHEEAPDLSYTLKELLNNETLEELQLQMEEVFVRMTTLVRERKEKRSSALADSVISYIHLNYTDPSLCLEEIADYLKYSKVYLSKIFREIHGQSVSEFITDYRISKVIEKLGEMSNLDQLLEEQGVTNKKYFYTLFKRKMGVSLREYRTKLVVQPLNEDNK